MRILFVACLLSIVSSGALAQRVSAVTGRTLMTACTGKSVMACDAYVDGFGDAVVAGGKGNAFACIPIRSTGTELRDVLVTYLKAHPEDQSQKAFIIAKKAFSKAYACGK